MESWSLPSSTSYFAEIGLPSFALAVSPRWSGIFASFRAFANSACSLSGGCDHPTVVTNTNTVETTTATVAAFIVGPPRWDYGFWQPIEHRRARMSTRDQY